MSHPFPRPAEAQSTLSRVGLLRDAPNKTANLEHKCGGAKSGATRGPAFWHFGTFKKTVTAIFQFSISRELDRQPELNR